MPENSSALSADIDETLELPVTTVGRWKVVSIVGKKMKKNGAFLAASEADEERSDEAGSAAAAAPPNSEVEVEVEAKPKRRRFTAAYRLRFLEEADRCQNPGEVGRLLRREGP